MPSPNFPNPGNIPDMSLGERKDAPSPIQPISEVSPAPSPPLAPPRSTPEDPNTYNVQPRPIPLDAKLPAGTPAPEHWRGGDRVLAPWEPIFLYPGVIREIKEDEAKGDEALIEFDDGGEGWVFVYSLCPVEVKVGQQIQARRNNGPTYFGAEVLEVSGEDIRVRFDSGGTEWTSLSTLRFPCIENGPGALATKLAPWQSPAGAPPATGGGIPSWVITIGIIVLLAFFRIGCRAMMQN